MESESKVSQNKKPRKSGPLVGVAAMVTILACLHTNMSTVNRADRRHHTNMSTVNRADRIHQIHMMHLNALDREFQNNLYTLDRSFRENTERIVRSYEDSLNQLHNNFVRTTEKAFERAFSEYDPQ